MQKLLDILKEIDNLKIKVISVDDMDCETLSVSLLPDISVNDTLKVLQNIYDWELSIGEYKIEDDKSVIKPVVNLGLKGINFEALKEAFRYSFKRYDMRNPFMLMNIFNFIKTYNTLTEDYLNSPEVYISNLEEATDLKLELANELKELKKQFSIYFLSTLKSYNKLEYTDKDNYPELPNMFKAFFNSNDLLTVCGIFADSPTFDTKDLVKVHNAFEYVTSMLERSALGFNLMENFLNLMEEEGKVEVTDTRKE